MPFKRRKLEEVKILDVDAAMQGSLSFKDPVNLRINGKFEGSLTTKGSLTIGEYASVNANIDGELVVVAGEVKGEIVARKSLKLIRPARVVGNVKTPLLEVAEGAILHGNCEMLNVSASLLSADEIAEYLELDRSKIIDWAEHGRIPAVREGSDWKFDRSRVEEWIASEKVK